MVGRGSAQGGGAPGQQAHVGEVGDQDGGAPLAWQPPTWCLVQSPADCREVGQGAGALCAGEQPGSCVPCAARQQRPPGP